MEIVGQHIEDNERRFKKLLFLQNKKKKVPTPHLKMFGEIDQINEFIARSPKVTMVTQ